MDCEDIELLLARDRQTTDDVADVAAHLASCAACREVAVPHEARWIATLPADALDDPDLLVLPTIDPIVYSGEQELARGGMGRITRVRDRRLGRDVAIKEVLDPRMRARFEREVAITAQLQHPAIVPVYEAGTWPDGSAFYAMRLVSGGTLAEAIARTPARLALLPHVIALVDALAYAHSRGIVHRDLKPQNVLVGEFGETVVIDWGLAKVLGHDVEPPAQPTSETLADRDLTRAGSVLGTPGFMAPEQAAGGEVDARSDVYALGAILRSVVCGTHDGTMPDDAPNDLRAVIDRAMANDPTARFASAKEMADELRRFQAGQRLASRTYGAGELLWRWIRRHRAIVIAGLLALVAIAVVAALAFVNVSRARAVAETTVTTLLEEQGRAALLAGEPERAATLLVQAYRRGGNSVALRHMLATATRDLDAPARTFTATNYVDAISYRPDGSLVTADIEGFAIWRDGRIVANHAFSASTPQRTRVDGVRVGIVNEREVQIYDIATGKRLWQVTAGDDPAVVLGATRIVVTADQGTTLHDAATGAVVATLVRGSVDGVDLRGDRVVTCKAGELVVWNALTGAQLAREADCYDMVAIGDRVVFRTGPFQLRAGTKTLEATPGIAVLVAQGDLVAARDGMGMLTLWRGDLQIGSVPSSTDVIAISPDGAYIAAGGPGERLRVWATDTMQLAHSFQVPGRFYKSLLLAWSADSRSLAAVRQNAPEITTFELPRSGRIARRAGRWATARDAVLGPNGELRRLATDEVIATLPPGAHAIARDATRALVIHNTTVIVVETVRGTRLATFTIAADSTVTLSADGNRILESTSRLVAAQVRVRDAATGKILREVMTTGEAALSPTGDRLALTEHESVVLVDVASGTTIRVPIEYSPPHVAFTPDGARVFGYGAQARARIVDARDGRTVTELPPPTSALETAAFDVLGRRLVTWGNDRAAHLWNAETGALLATVPRVDFAIAIAPDGARFAVATEEGPIQIWDTEQRRQIDTLPRDADPVRTLTWSGDGTRLVVNGNAFTTIWDVHLETRTPDELAALWTGYALEAGVLTSRARPRP